MPEEIGIALVIIVIVGWLLIKILQAFGRALGETLKVISDGLSAHSNVRFSQSKSRLSQYMTVILPNQLVAAEEAANTVQRSLQISRAQTRWEARRPHWVREEFKSYTLPVQDETYEDMNAEDVHTILESEYAKWFEEEARLLSQSCNYPHSEPKMPLIKFTPVEPLALRLDEARFQYDRSKLSEDKINRYFDAERRSVIGYNESRASLIENANKLNREVDEWNDQSRAAWEACVREIKQFLREELSAYGHAAGLYMSRCDGQKNVLGEMLLGYDDGVKDNVINRVHCVLSTLVLPSSIPRTWEIDFDEEERILVVDFGLPDVVHRPPFKIVHLKKGPVKKPLSQTEKKEVIPRVHPAILLRVAHELFLNDQAEIIRLLVLNGWVEFDDPSTGLRTKAYTASLMVRRDQIVNLNLGKIDPLVAFDSLHGKSAGKLVEIIPIEPALSLNRKDSRFADAKAVLENLGKSTNPAAMDWQDFEHLIRELFEKEFVGRGAEVKITQASRDRGVDAIAFDPDPIRGGKYVIQAKRYTHTVDVSAVRDLCAVVTKEGASRGILVTTSNYGADAYAFAKQLPDHALEWCTTSRPFTEARIQLPNRFEGSANALDEEMKSAVGD
jgi:restriction system protein